MQRLRRDRPTDPLQATGAADRRLRRRRPARRAPAARALARAGADVERRRASPSCAPRASLPLRRRPRRSRPRSRAWPASPTPCCTWRRRARDRRRRSAHRAPAGARSRARPRLRRLVYGSHQRRLRRLRRCARRRDARRCSRPPSARAAASMPSAPALASAAPAASRVTLLRIPGIYALDRAGGDPRERLARGTPVLRGRRRRLHQPHPRRRPGARLRRRAACAAGRSARSTSATTAS